MNLFINKIKILFKKIIYKIYKKKIKKLKILYSYNILFGDININLLNLNFLNNKKKKKIGILYGKILLKKYKKYIKNYKIKNFFLNINLKNLFYINFIKKIIKYKYKIKKFYFKKKNKKKKILIEFSSPNSNKPLHIGHLRNILIGNTISNIYKILGYKIIKSQIINNRGLHICKTIISYKYFNKKKLFKKKIKSDHLVGKLYFNFEEKLEKEINKISKKYKINKKQSLKYSKLFKLINKELIKWENKNKKSIYIWKKINNYVYKGFKQTYNKLNIKFNETLYESDTYLLGKNIILNNLNKKIFFLDKDKSIFFKYKNKKIILIRNNGTSLYITQEIGTLFYRFKKYKNLKLLIYVVGNEQINHFNILFKIFKKLKIINNIKLYHLSYNSVNYFGKKIKSRFLNYKKNNFIFIDDLINKLNKIVKKKINKLNKNNNNFELISLGAIKYYFLKVNNNKIINFNLKNILNLNGNTGIYIQYTYVRIYSILKRYKKKFFFIKNKINEYLKIIEYNEKLIIKYILEYNKILLQIKNKYDTSILINFLYKFTKIINNFYNKNKILKIKNKYKKYLRLILCKIILNFLYLNMKILGIPILKKI
ncbi:MAG: arginine--tRNA ligase [Candidatus Shikimatogenerans sp. JK-2022]|nr:arginine--tRNA ligase [Candidatus Shikimatogenerans bostrichidophilus]